MSDTLFYSPDLIDNSQLPEIESHHCVKVLRMRTGDLLTVTDGKGHFYQCALVEANSKRCTVNIINKIYVDKSKDFTLHIAFAPTKQMERNEWFVEKATEIGIDRFSPIISNYSERKEIKIERLAKTAISAMKQSQQPFLPLIDDTVSFNDFIKLPFNGKKFIAHCYETPKMPLSQIYKKRENALILIGPEGDFSENEVENAIDSGFEPISLGKSRLRTETASLVAAHTIHIINSLL
jgi:16S rRNA (uracil1498-N3)-methyltransferase